MSLALDMRNALNATTVQYCNPGRKASIFMVTASAFGPSVPCRQSETIHECFRIVNAKLHSIVHALFGDQQRVITCHCFLRMLDKNI